VADITTTFDGDGRPLENVIGRLSKDFRDFAKTAQSSFDSAQKSIDNLSDAGKQYNRVLDDQISKVKKLENASRIQAPGTSAIGLSPDQIKAIQAGLSESTREATRLAKEFTKELENASKVKLTDDQVREIQAGLVESRRAASELSQEINEVGQGESASVDFLKQQVEQYNAVLDRERELNKILDERLSKSKEIELAAKPQKADTSSAIGLTEEQVRRVQEALAESPRLARELTEEFLKQNAALNTGTDIIKRTGSELVKVYSKDLVKRTGSEIVKYAGDAAKKTAEFAKETGLAEVAASKLKGIWDGLLQIPDLPSLRYALYDVANTLQGISRSAAAFGVAPIAFSIQYEREFANVVRTSEIAGATMEETRKKLLGELRQIAQSTPIPWDQITNIATLGGQLGIATQFIAEFTDVVAKFAATTNLTIQGAATAFGRLNQLIRGVDGNFQGLGSAILAVGVSSVATESEIVNVTTQIASMGNLAGLTAAEIIGLGGAMASLQIRPELARGTITRLFSEIGRSAVDGGYNVEEFGRLTGRTADQFVSDWQTRPGEVLQDFFEGINNEGPKAERTLRQLGITSVRDIPTLLRLAQNQDEVRRIIALSSDEYVRANKINEQYGIISGTTAEQINRLTQNFGMLQATIGDSVGPLAGLFQMLNRVVQGLTAIAESRAGQVFSAIAIGASLLVAAITGLLATFAGAIAATIAWRFASRQLGVDLVTVIKGVFSKTAAVNALAGANAKATATTLALSAALRTIFIFTVIGALIAGAIALIGSFANANEQASQNVEKFFGSLDGLRAAIEKDTEAFDEQTGKMKDGTEALLVYEKQVEKTSGALKSNVSVAGDFIHNQEKIADSVDEATAAIENQTRAVSKNTQEYFKSQLLEVPELVDAFADEQFQNIFRDAGVDINELIAAGITGDAQPMIDALVDTAKKAREAVINERALLVGKEFTEGLTEEERARLDELNEAYDKYNSQITVLENTLTAFIGTQKQAIEQDQKQVDAQNFLADGYAETAAKAALARDEIDRIGRLLFSSARYVKSAEDAVLDYADALAEAGDEANSAAGAIGKAIDAILSEPEGDVDVILGNLAGLLAILEAQGPETADAQALVRQAIEEVGIEAGIQTPNIIGYAQALKSTITLDFSAFSDRYNQAMERVSSSSRGAAKEVKSLADQFKELTEEMFKAANAGQDAARAIYDLGKSYGEMGADAFYASKEIQNAVSSILAISDTPERAVANLVALYNQLARTAGKNAGPALEYLNGIIDQVAANFGVARDAVQGLANVDLSMLRKGIEDVQKEVVTLTDYASNLSSVFRRAFDIRFASVQRLDKIVQTWRGFAKTIEDARDAIEDLLIQQRSLTADRSIKQYFLSVAEAYGDSLRADKLRAEIAQLDRDIAKNSEEIADKTDAMSTSTEGNTDAAIRNRRTLEQLVTEYQEYIESLAASGASQAELTQAAEAARAEFIEQAIALGFAEEQVLDYAAAFDDVTFAIDNVPRNVTIEANVNPALTALRELESQQQRNINRANELNRIMGSTVAPSTTGGTGSGSGMSAAQRSQLQQELQRINLELSVWSSDRRLYEQAGNLAAWERRRNDLVRQRDQIQNRLDRGFAMGGFTGRGGMFEPAGVVHKGEYVIPRKHVDQGTGMPDLGFLTQMQNMRGYSPGSGGSDGRGTMMVELSPTDRDLLRSAGGSGDIIVAVDSREIARAANTGNRTLASGGYRP
jgi:TP901 family phage tail tape measure protein